MADGYLPIPRVVEGGESLVSAKYANMLIDAINALMKAKVAPVAGVGNMLAAGGQVVYDFTQFDQRLKVVEGLTLGPVGGNGVTLQNKVNSIIQSIDNATANASCGANNSITFTITFPNMPNV